MTEKYFRPWTSRVRSPSPALKSGLTKCFLKEILQPKLHDSTRSGALNTPESSAVVQVPAGGLEISVIQYIRSFCAELNRPCLFDLEYSGQPCVHGPESRAENGAGSRITEIS